MTRLAQLLCGLAVVAAAWGPAHASEPGGDWVIDGQGRRRRVGSGSGL